MLATMIPSEDGDDNDGNDVGSGDDDTEIDDVDSGSEMSISSDDDESDAADDSSRSDEEAGKMTSRDGKITWSKKAARTRRTPNRNIVRDNQMGKPAAGINPLDVKECLDLFVTAEMKDIAIEHSNEKGREKFGGDWNDMDEIEFDGFLGVLLLIGVLKGRNEDVQELWDEKFGRPQIRAAMGSRRFQQILSALRFDDAATREERRATDIIALVRDYINCFTAACIGSYRPNAEITVDEQLCVWRGKAKKLKVYIPSKPGKYGLKFWVVADAKTSYCINLQLYEGKKGAAPEVRQGARVVDDLCRHLYKTGRNITCDNLFTDYKLALDLLQQRTTILGTVRKSKREIPQEMLSSRSRVEFSTLFGFSKDNVTLCSYVPKKNRAVVLMSTMHTDDKVADDDKRKPEMITDYNRTKGGVDNLDKIVRTYSSKRKTRRWPVVVFFNLLDIAAYNALVIWMCCNPDWNANKKYRRRLFLRELGERLTKPLIERRSTMPQAYRHSVKRAIESTGVVVPPKKPREDEEGVQRRRRCHICPKSVDRKSQTVYSECKLPVCKAHSEHKVLCQECARDPSEVESD